MKKIFYLILLFAITSITRSQSLMVFDAETNIDVGIGADICADVVTINGTYSGGGTLCNGPLPVELVSFNALIGKNSVELNWKTETEVNNYGFEVERQVGGQQSSVGNWNKIGFVEGNGNSNSPQKYSFTDQNLVGGSIFKYRLKQIDTDGQFEYSDVVEVEIIPDKFALFQNYPNPFNPSTTIRFSLPIQTQLKVNIYNMLGELVKTVSEGTYEAGYYNIIFDAFGLSSGTYIYRIESDDFVETKKMILLK